MIGRGTRIFEKKDKMSFEILDFRDATTKYLDSIFNGDADEDEDYKKRRKEKPGNGDGPGGDGPGDG